MISKSFSQLTSIFFTALILVSPKLFAGSFSSINYSGRVLKPDNSTPFEGLANFRFEVKSDVTNCVLWREDIAINLAGSQGGMSMNVGLGANLAASSGHSFPEVFDNSKVLTGLSGCSVGTTYTPAPTEDRILAVSFNDGSSTQVLPNIAIKTVPFSLYADRARTALGLGSAAISLTAPTAGQVLQYNGGLSVWEPANFAGGGTVNNVGLIGSSIFSISGGPVVNAGTFSLSMASVPSGNFVLASPNGAPGVPTFRALLPGDVPSLPALQISSGTLSAAVGGTGLVPSVGNANKVYALNAAGTGTEFKSVTAGSGVTVDTSVAGVISIAATGSGGSVTSVSSGSGLSGGTFTTAGTISLATSGVTAGNYGGVGNYIPSFIVDTFGRISSAGSTAIAIDQILPSQTGNSGKLLSTNGTLSSWSQTSPWALASSAVQSLATEL
jgi:hypothetical protein